MNRYIKWRTYRKRRNEYENSEIETFETDLKQKPEMEKRDNERVFVEFCVVLSTKIRVQVPKNQ